jgi:hypothetical protein
MVFKKKEYLIYLLKHSRIIHYYLNIANIIFNKFCGACGIVGLVELWGLWGLWGLWNCGASASCTILATLPFNETDHQTNHFLFPHSLLKACISKYPKNQKSIKQIKKYHRI